jgi:hypothetical protein
MILKNLAIYTKMVLSKYVRPLFRDRGPYGELERFKETRLDKAFKGMDIEVHDGGPRGNCRHEEMGDD